MVSNISSNEKCWNTVFQHERSHWENVFTLKVDVHCTQYTFLFSFLYGFCSHAFLDGNFHPLGYLDCVT